MTEVPAYLVSGVVFRIMDILTGGRLNIKLQHVWLDGYQAAMKDEAADHEITRRRIEDVSEPVPAN